MDTLFGGANHVEKGGDLLHVEDAHHANLGDLHGSHEVPTEHNVAEIKE